MLMTSKKFRRGTVRDRASAVIRSHVGQFLAALGKAGFSSLTLGEYQRAAAHLGRWLDLRRISIRAVDAQILRRFRRHLRQCRCSPWPNKGVFHGIAHASERLVEHLRACGVIEAADAVPATEIPGISKQFGAWMAQHRGVVPCTVLRYQLALRPFFAELGEDPDSYNAPALRDFVIHHLGTQGRPAMRFAVTAMRAFLRFAVSEGLASPGVDRCIPTVPQWRLSALPRYLAPDDVQRLISSCDLSKAVGIRDQAVLLLLARLALRAGDIVKMRLDDVDWRQGTLRVRGKGRREVLLPLPQDVGDAVLAYLRHARPPAETNRLFLAVNAPIRPFASSASISDIVRFALDRAGIKDPPSHGANLLRHSAATAMLRAGSSLETIATVLRHRSSQTTAHYAKVDVEMLRQVIQPWPVGGASC
jgi:site-specific recombinase XerD